MAYQQRKVSTHKIKIKDREYFHSPFGSKTPKKDMKGLERWKCDNQTDNANPREAYASKTK